MRNQFDPFCVRRYLRLFDFKLSLLKAGIGFCNLRLNNGKNCCESFIPMNPDTRDRIAFLPRRADVPRKTDHIWYCRGGVRRQDGLGIQWVVDSDRRESTNYSVAQAAGRLFGHVSDFIDGITSPLSPAATLPPCQRIHG